MAFIGIDTIVISFTPFQSSNIPFKSSQMSLFKLIVTIHWKQFQCFCKFKVFTSFLAMKKSHENRYAIYLLTDGLLHIIYKRDRCIDLKAAQLIVRDRMTLQNGRKMPVFCDIREVRRVNKPARDYLALEGSQWITALAFLIDPPVTDVISSIYLGTHAQAIPTRAFTKKSEALEFLTTV